MAKKIFDVRKHNLVCQHLKLSEKEKEALFAQYNISMLEMPKIHLKDPALKGLTVKPGDVIKLIRPSPTAGEAISYRVVIRG